MRKRSSRVRKRNIMVRKRNSGVRKRNIRDIKRNSWVRKRNSSFWVQTLTHNVSFWRQK